MHTLKSVQVRVEGAYSVRKEEFVVAWQATQDSRAHEHPWKYSPEILGEVKPTKRAVWCGQGGLFRGDAGPVRASYCLRQLPMSSSVLGVRSLPAEKRS